MNTMGTLVLVLVGITMIFYIGGIFESTNTPTIIGLLIDPVSMLNDSPGTFWASIWFAIGTTAVTIIVGFFTKNIELSAMSAVLLQLVPILWSVNVAISKVDSSLKILSLLIFGPLVFYFILTVIDYWRGRD